MTTYYIIENGIITSTAPNKDAFFYYDGEIFETEYKIKLGPDFSKFYIQDGTQPPKKPSDAHIWDSENEVWIYHPELDSPGKGWFFENDKWVQKQMNSIDFQFFVGVEIVNKIHNELPNNTMLATLWNMLVSQSIIDLNNDHVKYILKCFTTEEYNSVLTIDEMNRILTGKIFSQ